jgi:hypothetical protein
MARRPVHIPKTVLSPRKRATLRASDFAVPSERKYPINDLFHARLALTYVLAPSNAAYRDDVVRAVMARYPELQFWWASRSKGVEAKRTTRKATSRRMPGQRMVANPRRSNPAADPTPMQRWSKKGVTVGLFDDFSGVLTVAAKTGDEDYLPVFRTKSYPAAVKYAEQYMSEVKTNPRPAKPASKRAGGRTAAQSNAAQAMKLFHSGKASSLAEAWAMLRRR